MHDLFAYPPRFMSRSEAARYLSMGTTMFDELVAEGIFPKPKKLRSKLVWDRIDLDAAANDVPVDGRTVTQTMIEHYRKKRQ